MTVSIKANAPYGHLPSHVKTKLFICMNEPAMTYFAKGGHPSRYTIAPLCIKESFMTAIHEHRERHSFSLLPFLITGILFSCMTGILYAQHTEPDRAYKPNAADEDWSFLSDGSLRNDFLDPLKYIPLGSKTRYVTLSGEFRFRAEGFNIDEAAGNSSTEDDYILQRYLLGADLHLGPRFRIFAEMQSGLIHGQLRSPRPTDEDPVDLHQGFFEFRQPYRNGRVFGIKAGRQEMRIGSSRLISASPGLNVKRSFDGVVLYHHTESWRLYGVFAKIVLLKDGSFDDPPDNEQTILGFSGARKSPRFENGELGFYYLLVDRANSEYNQGKAHDLRQTAGAKWSGKGERVNLNYDLIFQWGRFGKSAVRAWAFSTETGYRFIRIPGTPRFSFRFDMASGDKNPGDPELQSFNPLFPGSSYAGAVGLLGPTNLTDFNPSLTFTFRKTLVLGIEAPSYWRTSTADGIYSTDLKVLFSDTDGKHRYVGTNPSFLILYQATKHLKFEAAVTRFLSGTFLEETLLASGFGFYSATVSFRF